MSKANKSKGGIVYSTNPDFEYKNEISEPNTLSNEQQNLKIWLSRVGGNKIISRIEGFIGTDTDVNALRKQLQNLCGSGGSVKDNAVLIQGDHRDKILKYLLNNNYKAKKAGG